MIRSNTPRDARDAVTKQSKLSFLTTLTLIEECVKEHKLGLSNVLDSSPLSLLRQFVLETR